MIEKSKTGTKKKLNKIANNTGKLKYFDMAKYQKDLIIMEFLDYLKKASPPLSIKKKKGVLNLLYSTNIMNESDIDLMLACVNLGIKNKEEFLAEPENFDIISAYDSLPPDLQDLFSDIEASKERGISVTVKHKNGKHLAKVIDLDDLNKEKANNIQKMYTILVEIKGEIKNIDQKITDVEYRTKKIFSENTIRKVEERIIGEKADRINEGIDQIFDLNKDIYSELSKLLLSSAKEAKISNLPIPYIISLSLSTAVLVFCGVSLYVNIFSSIRLFDPYISLFWFFGSIGIGLMSLKGIFGWRDK